MDRILVILTCLVNLSLAFDWPASSYTSPDSCGVNQTFDISLLRCVTCPINSKPNPKGKLLAVVVLGLIDFKCSLNRSFCNLEQKVVASAAKVGLLNRTLGPLQGLGISNLYAKDVRWGPGQQETEGVA